MASPRAGESLSKRRPGLKPRGRNGVAPTITVTRAQRSISAVVRQFIADDLGADTDLTRV
jgi:hypothetical protein